MVKKVITFKHNGELVYSTVPGTYTEATAEVCRLFPDLQEVERSRLQFRIHTSYGKQQQNRVPVRIGPKAWSSMSSGLIRYEVVEVVIGPPETSSQEATEDDEKSISGMTLVSETRSRLETSFRNMFKP